MVALSTHEFAFFLVHGKGTRLMGSTGIHQRALPCLGPVFATTTHRDIHLESHCMTAVPSSPQPWSFYAEIVAVQQGAIDSLLYDYRDRKFLSTFPLSYRMHVALHVSASLLPDGAGGLPSGTKYAC